VAVRHRYGDDPSQFGELYLPDGPRRPGTVVIIHGGFWKAQYELDLGRPLAADLVARGYSVWNLEYRRVGNGGGWPATFEDVAAGIDILGELDVDTSRVVAIGHSAGGHLAVWAAGRRKLPQSAPGARLHVEITGVVAQAGVLALRSCAADALGGDAARMMMGGMPADLPDEYRIADPISAVPIQAPVICVHSRADDVVPFGQSVEYVTAATAAGATARLDEVDGDHFTVIDPSSAAWQLTVAALPALLSG
jgi:acetyl esterase/lipase